MIPPRRRLRPAPSRFATPAAQRDRRCGDSGAQSRDSIRGKNGAAEGAEDFSPPSTSPCETHRPRGRLRGAAHRLTEGT